MPGLRTRYGFNCQKVNWGKLMQMVPLGYMEVVPGETVSGSVTVNAYSAPTFCNVQTSVYQDIYAFYMPYRVAFEEWPQYIAGDDSVSLPTIGDTFPQNFENRLAIGPDGAPAVENISFQRTMYHKVFDEFFTAEGDQGVQTGSTLRSTLLRASTFETSRPNRVVPVESIDTSGASISVDDIRTAFSQDQFGKMRAFYGDRYVDYLRALGVNASWAILDKPEPIGQKHSDWRFRTVADTVNQAGDVLAFTAGYFNGSTSLRLKRTFCPEHGLIGVFLVVRPEPLGETSYVEPHLAKIDRNLYWSPEFETNKLHTWPSTLREDTATIDRDAAEERPFYEDYRKGLNNNAGLDISTTDQVMGLTAPDYQRSHPANTWDGEFDLTAMVEGNHYQATAHWRTIRNSPVKKHGQQKPLY